MRLDELRPAAGARTRRKRVGRGPASGHGKTAGRGTKGQKARSGGGKGVRFEGGQMPLYRRLPKRGFRSRARAEYAVVNVRSLGAFPPAAVVDPATLVAAGLLKKSDRGQVKILGTGDVPHALTVRAHAVSESARAKILDKGGSVELLALRAAAS